MDRLSVLLRHFDIKTQVFAYGTLHGKWVFEVYEGLGHVHIIKRAPLEMFFPDKPPALIEEPSLIFFAKPTQHSFRSVKTSGADVVCATVSLGNGLQSPLVMGLPECLVIPLRKLSELEKLFDLLYYEAFENRCGHEQALDDLMHYLVVRMYRYAIQEDLIGSSAIAGLADMKICKAMQAMHERPGDHWSLDTLSAEAGMSRARFAQRFKDKVGIPPMDYLTGWRLNLAAKHLAEGKPVKSLHKEFGYSSVSSFSRTFQQKLGMTPTEWFKSRSVSRHSAIQNQTRTRLQQSATKARASIAPVTDNYKFMHTEGMINWQVSNDMCERFRRGFVHAGGRRLRRGADAACESCAYLARCAKRWPSMIAE